MDVRTSAITLAEKLYEQGLNIIPLDDRGKPLVRHSFERRSSIEELRQVKNLTRQIAIGLGKGNIFTERGLETYLIAIYVKDKDLLDKLGLTEEVSKSVSWTSNRGVISLRWASAEAFEILKDLDDDLIEDVDLILRGMTIPLPADEDRFLRGFDLDSPNLGIATILTREEARSLLETIVKAKKLLRASHRRDVEEIEEEKKNLEEMIKYLIDNMEVFVKHLSGLDIEDFQKARTEVKASVIYNLIDYVFDVVRILPEEPSETSATYIAHRNVLYEPEEVINPIVGFLIAKASSRRNLVQEVKQATYSTGKTIYWWQIDPWDMLNLYNGVLDLRELKLKESSSYYFRYRLSIKISDKELDEIKSDSYEIEKNEVYRLWRKHFDDENWEYFVHSAGTWLRPERSKHIGFLIGPTNSGKSTLLYALTKPIQPIVAYVDLRSLTSYQFGKEGLIGKQIIVRSEKGENVLRNISVINEIMGERDYIPVHRKHKPPITIRSLKSMMVAMNDPPVVLEYGGGEFEAFIRRLSLIYIKPPDDFKPISNLEVDPKEAFIFLLWARRQLEKNNWVIKRKSDEEIMEILIRETNPVLKFLEESEHVEKDPSGRVKGKDLYDAYVKWSVEKGFKVVGLSEFYSIVGSKYQSYDREGAKWFRGLRLKR
jgi:phage/plasmid-associated DNA primase